MKVLVYKEWSSEPEVVEIEDTLENEQGIVGGYIEALPLNELVSTQEGVNLYVICNEEGKLNHLDYVRPFTWQGKVIDLIAGSFFVVGTDENGENVSLSDGDIETVKAFFERAMYLFFNTYLTDFKR